MVVVVVGAVVVVGVVVVVVVVVDVVVVDVVVVDDVVVVGEVVVVVFGGRPLGFDVVNVVDVDLGARIRALAPASGPGISVTEAITSATRPTKSAAARAPRAKRFCPRSAPTGATI